MHFTGYALLIGTGTTQSQQFAPIPVKNDIEAIKTVLVDPNICGYPAENIKVLTDEEATSGNIDLGLAWLKERSAQEPGATILFYYSGHGWSDIDDHYYLIQYNVSDDYLSDTAYDAQNLMARLGKIAARQMVIVLDCCRAGGVAEGKDQSTYVLAKGRASAPPADVQEALSQGGSRVVFASSLEGQKSWFHPQVAISLFTYYFLEGLQGGNAKANDTQVHIDQLIGHVSREVESASRAMPALQTPTFILKGLNFPVALLQGGKGLGSGGWPAARPQADEAIERVVRQVTQTVGDGGVAIGGDANDAIIMTGDRNQVARDNARIIDARGAQGYIEHARDVKQDFSQRTVNTGGGDYAEGDITKTTQSGGVNASGATFGDNATLAGRDVTQGSVTISGGTVNGPVTGTNQGTITYTTGDQDYAHGNIDKRKDNIIINNVVHPFSSSPPQPSTPIHSGPQLKAGTSEGIRLDVASPPTAVVSKIFDIAVRVSPLGSPPLTIDELSLVSSSEGEIYRLQDDDIVKYRVEVNADDCEVRPGFYTFRLRKGQKSPIQYFQLLPKREGRICIRVNAYQEDDMLAASQRVFMQVTIDAQRVLSEVDRSISIQQALDQLNPVLARLQERGDEEAHDQVNQVILYLRDALRAEQKSDLARRADKIRQAQRAFAEIAGSLPALAGLRFTFEHLV